MGTLRVMMLCASTSLRSLQPTKCGALDVWLFLV